MEARFINRKFSNVDELVKFAKEKHFDRYEGFDETFPFARLKSKQDPIFITIEYDSMIDCKYTESKLKKNCVIFAPKKYGKKGNIRTSRTLKEELRKLKSEYPCFTSYESLIWDLLIKHYENL